MLTVACIWYLPYMRTCGSAMLSVSFVLAWNSTPWVLVGLCTGVVCWINLDSCGVHRQQRPLYWTSAFGDVNSTDPLGFFTYGFHGFSGNTSSLGQFCSQILGVFFLCEARKLIFSLSFLLRTIKRIRVKCTIYCLYNNLSEELTVVSLSVRNNICYTGLKSNFSIVSKTICR
jgi:hypothetical protein